MVVERRKELTYLLSQAAELEHALMCQYLYAAFSLRSEAGTGLSPSSLPPSSGGGASCRRRGRGDAPLGRRAEPARRRWFRALREPAALPHQAKGHPPHVQLRLLPFGEAALEHFVYLERPEGVDLADARPASTQPDPG